MIIIKESKIRQLIPCKVGEEITSMLLEKFLDNLSCIEENAFWWSFKMKDLVGKISGDIRIWTKNKYAKFTKRLNKPEVKKKVFLRLANMKKDEKEEDS